MSFDFKCSMVAAAHIVSTSETTFRAIADGIRSSRWKKSVDAVRQAYATGGKDAAGAPKRLLPAVMFSGTFTERNAKALKKHSGVICVDLDDLNGTTEQFKERISSDPHTLAAFVSPTGSGLKVLFRCDPEKPHADSFHAAEHFMQEHFGLKIDQACKDVSRLCFISDDPEAFVADDAEVLSYPAPTPIEFHPAVLGLDQRPGDDYDSRHDLDALLQAHGWSKCPGGFTRPGKSSGLSATFGAVPGRLHIFTDAAPPFEPNHNYKPWHAYALLEHGGDFSAAARALVQKGYGTPLKSRQQQTLDHVAGPAEPLKLVARPITSYSYPSEDDPNIILGSDDYLGRGGGLLFVSHAGAGKSSWAMDACMMWALGRAWMMIKSHSPRKVLIIQAEDSDRYIGKIFASFAHINKLTPEDLALLTKNCVIIRLKGVSGADFFKALIDLTTEHCPDLVVINPIYLYAEGDITRSEFAQPFLKGLDAVNKAEKFAYILIHHTGKPTAKGSNGKRAEVEDWESAYMGFGSSYLANWPRASILLEPVPGNPGHYPIKLGKGGYNAGITKQVAQGAGFRDEPSTRIAIRHSKDRMPINGKDRPVYYWEMDDEAPADSEKGKGGKPRKYQIGPFMRFIPANRESADTAPKLFRAMNGASGIPASSWADLLFRAATEGQIMLAEIPGKGPCYYRKTDSTDTHGYSTDT